MYLLGIELLGGGYLFGRPSPEGLLGGEGLSGDECLLGESLGGYRFRRRKPFRR